MREMMMRAKAIEREELRSKSKEELRKLVKEDELQLLKWNKPEERNLGAFATRGKGHPYKKIKKRIAFMKMLLAGKKDGRAENN